MRNLIRTLDADDRRAMARGVAAGLGLITLLALHADWVLWRGVLAFRRTGENVAASIMGLNLLPWTLLFTAALAGAVVIALRYRGTVSPERGVVLRPGRT